MKVAISGDTSAATGEEENQMAFLPDELWILIFEIGIGSSNWEYKDLCRISITCKRFNRLSGDNHLWSSLLSSDFSHSFIETLNKHLLHLPNSPFKSFYKLWFEREKERKLLTYKRTVLRMESRIAEHQRKIDDMQQRLAEETERVKATVNESSNLHRVRQASTALNVWKPEIIRGRQKQIVEQSVVPADYRIHALEMELDHCRKQIAGLIRLIEMRREGLMKQKEQLASIKYHPLRDYNSIDNNNVEECRGIKRQKSKKYVAASQRNSNV